MITQYSLFVLDLVLDLPRLKMKTFFGIILIQTHFQTILLQRYRNLSFQFGEEWDIDGLEIGKSDIFEVEVQPMPNTNTICDMHQN